MRLQANARVPVILPYLVEGCILAAEIGCDVSPEIETEVVDLELIERIAAVGVIVVVSDLYSRPNSKRGSKVCGRSGDATSGRNPAIQASAHQRNT